MRLPRSSHLSALVVLVFAGLVSPLTNQAQNTTWSRINPAARLNRRESLSKATRFTPSPSPQLPASATGDVIPTKCPQEAVGAVCGYVKVPLDRRDSTSRKIRIFFELYPHSNSGLAESAILANIGGPGVTTTGIRDFWLGLYGANLDVHDLLLIDDRGRGLSNTIDCEELQHATAPLDQAEADCAAQLGTTASRYGSGDIAQDTEAVRSALGYDKVDYHGGSYGGADVTAYATRFGAHMRSVVLDAPFGTPALNSFSFEQARTHAMLRKVRLDCLRSPTCAPDHPNPDSELSAFISFIRTRPFEGDAYDASGNLLHARVDEDAVLNYMIANATGVFTSTGEVLAAAAALSQGDQKPLLRLAAEGLSAFPQPLVDQGDPTGWSVGAQYATKCSDAQVPWDWSAPVSTRMAQYAQAVAALPSNYFAPFSKAAATGLLFSGNGAQCLWWQRPSPPSPVAPAEPTYPNAPTIVLNGDMDSDVPLEETSKVAALFPNSTLVTIPEAGHESIFWSPCAGELASQFIANLQADASFCSSTPETVFQAVGRFPLFASQARPADVDPSGSNQIGTVERKVATVAVATVTDALQRTLIGSGEGVGLRAGAFHTDFTDTSFIVTLFGSSFASDVTVNGTVTWAIATDGSLVADLQVAGSGTKGGTLRIEGVWLPPGHNGVGQFRVTGALGDHRVAVLVPEA
jgi:pimeloyl-ACP methyl ester carboxylesterase